MNSSTVLVLGAHGRFGSAAVVAFANAGWQVIAHTRRSQSIGWPSNVRVIFSPMADIDSIVALASEASVVVYAVNPLYTLWDRDMLPLARQGMDIAMRLKASFMLPGNIYNYGISLPTKLTEETPHPTTRQANTRKGLLRCELEKELRDRTVQGLSSVVIRAGDFFGAGSGSWLDQLIVKNIAKGKLTYPGPLSLPHAWAYLPDLAMAFVAVASAIQRSALGPLGVANFHQFNFAGHNMTGWELLDHLETAAVSLGLRPKRGFSIGEMPWGLIRLGGLVYPMWRELASMSYLWHKPHRLDGTALRRAIGPLPSTEPGVAVREALIALGHGIYSSLHPKAAV